MRVFVAWAMAASLAACRTAAPAAQVKDLAPLQADAGDNLKQCVGIHGNGQKIFIHFSTLARLVETFGLMDGISGGSSAAITSFFYESSVLNPQVWRCGGATCGQKEAAERVALLLKSLNGYAIGTADRSLPGALEAIGAVFEGARSDAKTKPLQAAKDLLQIGAAVRKLKAELQTSSVGTLINWNFFARIEAAVKRADVAGARKAAKELTKTLTSFGQFDVTEPGVLLRDGPIRFEEVAARIGVVGDFYAARYNDAAFQSRVAEFLAACAPIQHGKSWAEIAATTAADGSGTCNELFGRALDAAKLLKPASVPRIADPTSALTARGAEGEAVFSVSPLLTTSVIRGADGPSIVRAARKRYLETGVETLPLPFSAVAFGYWGENGLFQRLEANRRPEDFRLQRAVWLGDGAWRDVLTASTAEPGISAIRELAPAPSGEAMLSAGGWVDLHPSLTLRRAGCERVFLISRPGEPVFPRQVVKLLGASDDEAGALFDPVRADSALTQSVLAADATVCFNFDDPKYDPSKLGDLLRMGEDAYRAPIAIAGPSAAVREALTDAAGDWPKIDAITVGCRGR